MMETAYPESPLDFDDAAYPCKGCGEILEEGKAFELAGNRWHIDCFRCNTCGTLLDSDANLLLLGDGSLICNNCTYSCSSCGNKIEDLAILTGDQAFCANCFKCRNCKRKIENLRYARTSQGIFCMDCHEALMARRRKKSARGASGTKKHTHLDKSLPSLPPPGATKQSYESGVDTLWPETYAGDAARDIPSVSRTVSELQADGDTEVGRSTVSSQNLQQPSPHPASLSKEPDPTSTTGLTLPSTTYRNNRHSYQSARSTEAVPAGNEEFLIPLAFDPTPVQETPSVSNHGTPRIPEDRPAEYFPRSSLQAQAQARASATQANTSHPTSPHIAFQEKGRQPSHDYSTTDPVEEPVAGPAESLGRPPFLPERNRQRSAESSTVMQLARGESSPRDSFKLQEPPKSRADVRPEGGTSRPDSGEAASRTPLLQERAMNPDVSYGPSRASQEASPRVNGSAESPRQAFTASPPALHNIPKRGDSLESAAVANKRLIPRKELNANASVSGPLGDYGKESSSSIPVAELPGDLGQTSSERIISAPITSPASQSILDTANTPQLRGDHETGAQQPFVEPRAAPQPPFDLTRPRTDSLSNLPSDSSKVTDQQQKSPKLPRWSGGGDFTLDEDMARILGGEELSAHESFLRRVSNSVRHGRSYSDKSGRTSRDRWPRSPVASTPAGQDIGSPGSTSPDQREEIGWYKTELRREKDKGVEREKRIAELEAQFESSANIKQANSELREKRSTIVVLDTQREMVVRELETLTEHIARARASTEPVDFAHLRSAVLRDFAESLEKLKNSFAPQIEDSIQRRNDLLAEITHLGTMKDKSFQEFEQLSSKNAQLAELNNQLVHQIQDIYKANSGLHPDQTRSPAPNGLGIYSHHKDRSQISIESRDLKSSQTEVSMTESSTTLQGDAESIQVIGGPNVVSIKKMQPKKFDWRKGQKVAKGMAKGVKGAFTSTQQSYNRDLQFAETGAYGQLPSTHEQAGIQRGAATDSQKQGFGFFGNPKTTQLRGNGTYATSLANPGGPSTTPDPATHLFGSDLEQRAEYEKTSVPAIVKRCVEEVESRGMDQEGIYRKSGGNSQVQQVKDSFEQPGSDLNISDPDLDIHAVTSCLKQYFRRLPSPLITYEVYDRLLEATSIPDGPSQSAQRLDAISDALHELPRIHYQTLEYLVRHLRRVVLREKENLMTPLNIAVVFAPTIMRPESVSRELTDTRAKNEVVMWMVENVERVFTK